MSNSIHSSPARSIGEPIFKYATHNLPVEIEGLCDLTILSGWLKFRDQKKWKTRWGVVTKLSPAADCIHVQLYKDPKHRFKPGLTKASLSLENFLCLETGFTLDKESNTIAVICRNVSVIFAFETRQKLIQWQIKINNHFGEGKQFAVLLSSYPSKFKFSNGLARLYIQNYVMCLTTGIPPRLSGFWELKYLRRYGVLNRKFCIEAGSLCETCEGVFIFLSEQAEEIKWYIKLAIEGRLNSTKRHITRNLSDIISIGSRKSFQRDFNCNSPFYEHNRSDVTNNYRSSEDVSKWPSEHNEHRSFGFEDMPTIDYSNSNNCLQELGNDQWKDRIMPSNTIKHSEFYSPDLPNKFGNLRNISQEHSPVNQQLSEHKRLYDKPILPPQIPPKPSKYRYLEHTSRYPSSELYDTPKGSRKLKGMQFDNEHPSVQSDINKFKTPVHQRTARNNNYDIPPTPIAVPNTVVCICKNGTRVVLQSKENDGYYGISCKPLANCLPYNWLNCGETYNQKEPDSPIRNKKNTNNEYPIYNIPSLPTYAMVDFSKKNNRKKPADTTAMEPSIIFKPLRNNPNGNQDFYQNFDFTNSLKYYENARQFIECLKNEKKSKEFDNSKCQTCGHTVDENKCEMLYNTKTKRSCSAPNIITSISHIKNHDEINEKSIKIRRKSNSMISIRGEYEVDSHFSNKILKSETSYYKRDSSSSNDSGFSFGSNKFGQKGRAFELRENVLEAGKLKSLFKSEYYNAMQFQHRPSVLKSSSAGAEIPLYPRKVYPKIENRELYYCKSEGATSSIPYMDGQSTSSETSDISDYMETLSLSSHSSSEAQNNNRSVLSNASKLRPRSGKEYEKIDRILVRRRIELGDKNVAN